MKKNKKIMTLSFILCALILGTMSVNAYELMDQQPGTTTFNWVRHETLPDEFYDAAVTAQQKWSEFSIRVGFDSAPKEINFVDKVNTIYYCNFKDIGLPSSPIGATVVTKDGYRYFDMGFNSRYKYGNGSKSSYYDRQGLITHEFGHVCGLKDLGLLECSDYTKRTVPTMYGKDTFDGTKNIYYYLRSLSDDDKSGMEYTSTH